MNQTTRIEKRFLFAAIMLELCLCLPGTVRADVAMPLCFSDHMVLQRDMPVRIWGTADPGEKVTVSLLAQSKEVVADAEGQWSLKLDPLSLLPEGKSAELTIVGKNRVVIKDVLVGEVWLGSGQSNMDLSANTGGKQEINSGIFKEDYVLTELIKAGPYPNIRLLDKGKQWQEATPENLQTFSALFFPFGLRLQRELKVPVGLMEAAVGGTSSRYWLTEEMLKADDFEAEVERYKKRYTPEMIRKMHEDRLAQFEARVAKCKAEGRTNWGAKPELLIPGDLSTRECGSLYRAHVEPLVGYTIRGILWDQGESGTALTEISQRYVMGALIKGWRTVWGQGETPFLFMEKESGRGCAWDYQNPVTRLARPFVPLAPDAPVTTRDHRFTQFLRIMEVTNAWMVTTSDLGPGGHPVNKSGYGSRAADVALNRVYGKANPWCGPTFARYTLEGSSVRIFYDNIGKGLAFKHGDQLQGFVIFADRGRYWANARIDGDTVVLSHPKVSRPVRVAYAWDPLIPYANLFSKDGLPALPFKIDIEKHANQ